MINTISRNKTFNNFLYFLILVLSINILEIDTVMKGIFFITISLVIIYLDKVIIFKYSSLLIIAILILFNFINNNSYITEKSSILKISEKNNIHYENLFGKEIYNIIKPYYLKNHKQCYESLKTCFEDVGFIENHISPDQNIWNIDKTISRKINKVNFRNIAELRPAFINNTRSRLNRTEVSFEKKLTPYFVNYAFNKNINEICFKGLIIAKSNKIKKYHSRQMNCFKPNDDINEIYGFQIEDVELSIKIKNNNTIIEYLNYFVFLILLLYFYFQISFKNIINNLKLFIPVLTSTIIIFVISSYNGWFNFNLFNFYFYLFEGGDGITNVNFMYDIFISLVNYNLVEVIRGGNDVFFFAPGLRYFLLLEKILFGDYYYLLFFIIFIIPIIFLNLFNLFLNKKLSYILFLSFLLIPILHHIGISYFQYIRHTYRVLSEPMGYMCFFYALTQLLINHKDNKLEINLMFFLSVLFRPSLLLTVFIITAINFLKDIYKNLSLNLLIFYFLVLILYLTPLFHNMYFGNQFVLWTSLANDVFNYEYISSKNIFYYYPRIFNFTTLLCIVVLFIPTKFKFLKIIIISQYLTLFYFELNFRYYWIVWTLLFLIQAEFTLKKLPILKNFFSFK